jgi:hypothetical protein
MKPFEGSARAIGWVWDEELHPGKGWNNGVVHPQGWWAADWQEALRFSLEERKARHEDN